jgi:hypothetical protein
MPNVRNVLRSRWGILLATILVIIVALVAISLGENPVLYRVARFSEVAQLVVLLVGAAGAVVGIIQSYLQHGARTAEDAEEQARQQTSPIGVSALVELAALESRLASMQQQIDTTSRPLTDDQRSVLARAITNELASAVLTEKLQEVSTRVGEVFNRDRALEALERNSVVSLARLSGAIPEMSKRANFNLAIGITTTLIGVIALAVAVFTTSPSEDITAGAYLAQFAPRLSLAILIEVFAYFFLRLYKENLASVSSLRDEMTRVEVARTVLAAVTFTGDKESIARIADAVVSQETAAPSGSSPSSNVEQAKSVIELLQKLVSVVQPKAG